MRKVYSLKDLPQRKSTRFSIVLDTPTLAQIATELDLISLKKLRFDGELMPISGSDWALHAQLGATVVQPCRVSLEPVTTRIEEQIKRQYLANFRPPIDSEAEMPDDDTKEPLPDEIDIIQIIQEALALAIPAFPRRDDISDTKTSARPQNTDPMEEETVKPFAALAELRAQMGETPEKDDTK